MLFDGAKNAQTSMVNGLRISCIVRCYEVATVSQNMYGRYSFVITERSIRQKNITTTAIRFGGEAS